MEDDEILEFPDEIEDEARWSVEEQIEYSDILDRLVRTNCKRKITKWPVALFYDMNDVCAVNANYGSSCIVKLTRFIAKQEGKTF